jgi:hypothetical protein
LSLQVAISDARQAQSTDRLLALSSIIARHQGSVGGRAPALEAEGARQLLDVRPLATEQVMLSNLDGFLTGIAIKPKLMKIIRQIDHVRIRPHLWATRDGTLIARTVPKNFCGQSCCA